jgi:putative N6-adenine-specific DNA methylase
VFFEGPFELAMRACLHLRTASKVLLLLGEFRVRHEQDVYDAVRSLPLNLWFGPDHTICVRSHAPDRAFRNSHFLSLRIKDAIVDHLRERYGRRPSVDTQSPDIEVIAHVDRGAATLYLGMQGAPLNQRGYRKMQTEAPLKESLAASLLAFSGWDRQRPMLDPVCGSGTIAIEAALLASNRAPGLLRSFGFERWPRFDEQLARCWAALREEAQQAVGELATPIRACDIDPQAIKAARVNAVQAGVGHCIDFRHSDFAQLDWGEEPLEVLGNPPYGERLGALKPRLAALHAKLGDKVRSIAGAGMTLISVPELLRQTHLKPDARLAVFNGPLRCEMARYAIRADAAVIRLATGEQS